MSIHDTEMGTAGEEEPMPILEVALWQYNCIVKLCDTGRPSDSTHTPTRHACCILHIDAERCPECNMYRGTDDMDDKYEMCCTCRNDYISTNGGLYPPEMDATVVEPESLLSIIQHTGSSKSELIPSAPPKIKQEIVKASVNPRKPVPNTKAAAQPAPAARAPWKDWNNTEKEVKMGPVNKAKLKVVQNLIVALGLNKTYRECWYDDKWAGIIYMDREQHYTNAHSVTLKTACVAANLHTMNEGVFFGGLGYYMVVIAESEKCLDNAIILAHRIVYNPSMLQQKPQIK